MVTGIHQDQKIKRNQNGEELTKKYSYTITLSANRVTPDIKIRFWARTRYNENRFTFDDDIIKSTSEQNNFSTTFWKLSFPTIKKPCTLMVQGLNVTFNWNKLVSRSLTV